MILRFSAVNRGNYYGTGYIAGAGDGIVTVLGKVAERAVYLYALYDYKPMVFVAKTWSDKNGHYMFSAINANQEYLLMVRDYKGEFEPTAWDKVKPATDLTIAEQYALRQSWQTQ